MHILKPEEERILEELLIEDLPYAVHNMVTLNPRISEAALVGRITNSLPSTIDSEVIRRRCITSIRWFVHNGDLSNAGNKKYVMLPPYGVLQAETGSELIIKICGDRILDQSIDQKIQKLGLKLNIKFMNWYWETDEEQKLKTVGFRRTVSFQSEIYFELANIFSDNQVPLVTPKQFCDKLPKITDITIPPESQFNISPPNWGYWYIYNSSLSSLNRWEPIEFYSKPENYLFKWQPSEDWRGESSKRFFIHKGLDHIAEIDSSSARLWMFYLDSQNKNQRTVWTSDEAIFVPMEIPEPYQHWLQLISIDWNREKGFRKYHLLEDFQQVAEILKNSLQVTVSSGIPNEERN